MNLGSVMRTLYGAVDVHSRGHGSTSSFDWAVVGPVLLGLVPLLGLAVGIREWIYGGSVLSVQLHLALTDGLAIERASVSDFRVKGELAQRFGMRITNPKLDVAVVTVRNRGRTAATILHPGLRFVARGTSPVFVGGVLLPGLGEVGPRFRIEAHDSKTFVMPLAGMVQAAITDIDFQKPQDSSPEIRARAQVTSGTGREKRSSRCAWAQGRLRRNSWHVSKGSLDGRALDPTETLMAEFVNTRSGVYDQLLVMGYAVLLASSGKSSAEILEELNRDERDLLTLALMSQRAVELATKK